MYYDVNLEIDYKAVGARVKAAREKKGLKQHNLAALTEISPTNISHIERGKTKLSLPTLMKLVKALDSATKKVTIQLFTKRFALLRILY